MTGPKPLIRKRQAEAKQKGKEAGHPKRKRQTRGRKKQEEA